MIAGERSARRSSGPATAQRSIHSGHAVSSTREEEVRRRKQRRALTRQHWKAAENVHDVAGSTGASVMSMTTEARVPHAVNVAVTAIFGNRTSIMPRR